jgi:hypothetical protein
MVQWTISIFGRLRGAKPQADFGDGGGAVPCAEYAESLVDLAGCLGGALDGVRGGR